MILKEPMDISGDNTPDTHAEDTELRALLQEAYPDPKGKIAAAVMAEIRAGEEAQRKLEQQLAREEKTARRRKWQGLVMKWGGLAACVTILSGALVIASPMFDRTADMAAEKAEPADGIVYAAQEKLAYAEAYSDALADTAIGGGTLTVQASDDNGAAAYSGDADVTAEDAEEEAVQKSMETVSETTAPTGSSVLMSGSVAMDLADDRSGYNAGLAEWLIGEGHLSAASYENWMQDKGYADAGDWSTEDLLFAFRLDGSLIEAYDRTLEAENTAE